MRYYDSENVLIVNDGYHTNKPLPEHDTEPGYHGHEFVEVDALDGHVAWAGPAHGNSVIASEKRRGRHFAIHRHGKTA